MKREIQLPFLCLPIEIVKVKAREILYRQNCIITCSRKLSANKVHNLYKVGNVAENYVEVQCEGALYDRASQILSNSRCTHAKQFFFKNVNT